MRRIAQPIPEINARAPKAANMLPPESHNTSRKARAAAMTTNLFSIGK